MSTRIVHRKNRKWGDGNAFGLPQTHPLLKPLWERIREWRREIALQRSPDLEMLQEALDRAQHGGVEASFCVYVIGNCEWLFRVYDPGSVIIRKALQDRLQTRGYRPFPPVPHPWMLPQLAPCVQTGGVSLATNKYVDARLGEIWDRQGSETCRRVLLGQLEDLVREFDQPFLPATLQPLSPKRGGYPELISWVAATVIYQCVKLSHPNKQDSQAIRAAQALVAALKNKADGVDRSQFHRKRRAIENTAPQLSARFVQGYEDLTEVRKISMEDVLRQDQGVAMTWYWLSEKEGAALLSSTMGDSPKTLSRCSGP